MLRKGSSSCCSVKSRVSCRYHSSFGSRSLKVGLHSTHKSALSCAQRQFPQGGYAFLLSGLLAYSSSTHHCLHVFKWTFANTQSTTHTSKNLMHHIPSAHYCLRIMHSEHVELHERSTHNLIRGQTTWLTQHQAVVPTCPEGSLPALTPAAPAAQVAGRVALPAARAL